MADIKPLKLGGTGVEQFGATDTVPAANIADHTSAKITDFTEAAQDAVGAMVDANSLVYTDGTPKLEVKLQMSLTSDASGVKLSGDSATPGNSKYYGTDSGGTKGWFTLPSGTGETYTAGENIAAGDLVYLNSSGQLMKADANTIGKEAIGFCQAAIASAASGLMYRDQGQITGLTGLTAGSLYALSNTTAGGVLLASTISLTSPDFFQAVGRATSTTVLQFKAGPTILVS